MANPNVGSPAIQVPEIIAVQDYQGNLAIPQTADDLTLLASALRTSTTTGQANAVPYGRAVLAIFLNVTAASGTGGLKIIVQSQDPVSGNWSTIFTATTAVIATGCVIYLFGDGVASGGAQGYQSQIGRNWRVAVSHGDSTNYTYSVGASVIYAR